MADPFDELEKDGEAAIQRWIGMRKEEGLYFDCKLKKNFARPELDSEDRANLAKSLSGFANSDGGVLLWGVDARKKDGIDGVLGKQPLANIKSFRSNVEQAISELIAPPIPGVCFLTINCSEDRDFGYLAISVPPSDRRPHMSRNNKEAGFYFRNGHQTILMELFQIRDQMLRKVTPKLEFSWDVRVRNEDIGHVQIDRPNIPIALELILNNISFVSARFPYLLVKFDLARYISMGPSYKRFAIDGFPIVGVGLIAGRSVTPEPRSFSKDWEFAGGADRCIHPGTALRIAEVRLDAPANLLLNDHRPADPKRLLQPRFRELPTVLIEVAFGCLDAPIEKIPLEMTGDAMNAKLIENGQDGLIMVP